MTSFGIKLAKGLRLRARPADLGIGALAGGLSVSLGSSRRRAARKGQRGIHPLLGAAVIGFILMISPPAGYVHKSAHGQTLDSKWGAPVDPQGAADRAAQAAKERLDRLEHCYKFPGSPSERCRIQREDDQRPSEKHHERQVHERRWN
jgi:hypothetical protein